MPLDQYESLLKEAFSQLKIKYENVDSNWPSVFDRFVLFGKEIDYRTIYVALCSQAHNDAEDLLNLFVSSVLQIEGMKEARAAENKYSSITMILIAIRFLMESSAMYLGKFSISINETLLPLYRALSEYIEKIADKSHQELEKKIKKK